MRNFNTIDELEGLIGRSTLIILPNKDLELFENASRRNLTNNNIPNNVRHELSGDSDFENSYVPGATIRERSQNTRSNRTPDSDLSDNELFSTTVRRNTRSTNNLSLSLHRLEGNSLEQPSISSGTILADTQIFSSDDDDDENNTDTGMYIQNYEYIEN